MNPSTVETRLLKKLKIPLNNKVNGSGVDPVYGKLADSRYKCLWVPLKQQGRQQTEQAGGVFQVGQLAGMPAIAAANVSGIVEVLCCADEEATAAGAAEVARRKPRSGGAQVEWEVKKLEDVPAATKLLQIIEKLSCRQLKQITGCRTAALKQELQVRTVSVVDWSSQCCT